MCSGGGGLLQEALYGEGGAPSEAGRVHVVGGVV